MSTTDEGICLDMNILVLSCGTRNKIVQYFRSSSQGEGYVVAADCSRHAPALYDADKHYIVPRMTDPAYLDHIFDICRKEHISGVLSLIDPELSLLAAHAEAFLDIGVKVIGSSFSECERSLDKIQMYDWLKEHKYRCARTYADIESFDTALTAGEIEYPVFVKPARGSASLSISAVDNRDMLVLLFQQTKGLIIQEFLRGQEIGADVYIDMISREVVSIFTKKKLVMRAGETDKAVSFKDDDLFALIDRFTKESGYAGAIDIDIFEIEGCYYISEVNPRFGGGYVHAHACGCDFPKLIYNNLCGKANAKNIGAYDENVYMMKYNEFMVRK